MWHAVARFIEALRKMPGSRGFDFPMKQLDFSIDII